MADKAWSLSDEQRAETVSRVAQNIESLAFSRGIEINDAEARSIANAVEKKAYTTASVEATTTTGFRPHEEALKSYARCDLHSVEASHPLHFVWGVISREVHTNDCSMHECAILRCCMLIDSSTLLACHDDLSCRPGNWQPLY